MISVLVTGSRGKTGRLLVEALRQSEGVRVIAASRQSDGDRRLDWDDKATWKSALSGAEALYLVKPTNNLTDPHAEDVAERVRGFLASADRLKRVVLLSEIGAADRDEALDEKRVERAVEQSGLDWTILRPNWFMQNFSDPSFYLKAIREEGRIAVPKSGMPTSFIDSRDIADCAAKILLHGGHAQKYYTLTGQSSHTWSDAMSMISKAAGHSVTYSDVPLEEFLSRAHYQSLPARVMAHHRKVYELLSSIEAGKVTGDTERILNRSARGFEDFVRENTEVWRRKSSVESSRIGLSS